jgi:hypothetical protein
MIRAGVMYLEKVTNKNKNEILKMSYPEYREYISFYTKPEDFDKVQLTDEEKISELEKYKRMKRELEGR